MTEPGGSRLTPPSEPFEPYSPPWGEASPEPPVQHGPAAPYTVPAQYFAPTGQQTHPGAVWAMTLGIIGVVCGVLALPTSGLTGIGLVCSPVALGLGIWSGRVIRSQPQVYGNGGMATAGLVLGVIGLAIGVLLVLLALAVVALILWLFSSAGTA